MIDVPPPITWLIVCLLCCAVGYIAGHQASRRQLGDYLRMTMEERRAAFGCRWW